MRRRTKIVATLGPAVDSREGLRALLGAGVNVCRLNCSHGEWDQKRRWIEWIRELSPPESPVAVLADLQGPKFRIGSLPDPGLILTPGATVTLGPEGQVPLYQEEVLAALGKGDRLLLGDGEIELRITGEAAPDFEARVVSGGTLRGRKGVTVVGKGFDVPALTDKDREDAAEALRRGCDFLALSYVKHAADVRELRALVPSASGVGLCAKIETREALHCLPEILDEVDLVMVARGDMGLQMDGEDVPLAQKRIIARANLRGIPVITATQMLESMIVNPRPTRAETTDVFNAILDGTDAVMLSAETAAGAHPVDCVRTMARICEAADREVDPVRIERDFVRRGREREKPTVADAVAHAAAEMVQILDPAAVLCTSTGGQTPRLVAKYRPDRPILCATRDERTARRLAVVWGVEALWTDLVGGTDESVEGAIEAFVKRRRLKPGDRVVVTAGVPMGVPGNTNLVQVREVPPA